MIKRLCLFLLIFSHVLVACGTDELPTTPTPFGFGDSEVVVVAAAEATAVPLAELVAEPEAYDGQFVQLSGQYKRLPLLICSGETHPGPATWTLVTLADSEGDDENAEREEIIVAVDGLDSQLRALIDEGSLLTVNGYWRFWEGVVGCGKQAVPSQMWYLKATELVAPVQLARVTAVSTGDESDGDPGTAVATPPVTPTIPITLTPTTAVITATIAPPFETPIVETPFIEPTTVPTTEDDKIETETPTPTIEVQITGTPPVTGTPGTPTNTPPPGSTSTPTVATTPVATGQPGSYSVIEVDAINPDNGMFGYDTLESWQKQNWPLTLNDSTVITIGVAAEPTMDIAIAVFDDSDTPLRVQNNAPAGQLEEIQNLPVDPNGTYIVQVYDANGIAGHYFMSIVGNETGLVLLSKGILAYGATRQVTIAEDHNHFWYFYGQAGDVVDITTVAQGDDLMLLSLYDQRAALLDDENGNSLQYEEEEILDVTLPETGLYLIWVSEEFSTPASYSITVTKN